MSHSAPRKEAEIRKGYGLISQMLATEPRKLALETLGLLRKIEVGYQTSEMDPVEIVLMRHGLVKEEQVDIGSAMLFVKVTGFTAAGRAVRSALDALNFE